MNIVAHGIDLVDCNRLAKSIDRHGSKFLERVFTEAELKYCQEKQKASIQSFAGRFAIKEAVMKVLGTGWAKSIAWTDIEVHNLSSGKPVVLLHQEAKRVAANLGIGQIHISISHTKDCAIGSAIDQKAVES